MNRWRLGWLVAGLVLAAGGCGASRCPTQCKSGVCRADGSCQCTKQGECMLLHAACIDGVCVPAPDGGGPGGGAGGGSGGGGGTDAGP